MKMFQQAFNHPLSPSIEYRTQKAPERGNDQISTLLVREQCMIRKGK